MGKGPWGHRQGRGESLEELERPDRIARIHHGLVVAGGEVVAGEPPPGSSGWKVGIDTVDSDAGAAPCTLLLSAYEVSTSGDARALKQSVRSQAVPGFPSALQGRKGGRESDPGTLRHRIGLSLPSYDWRLAITHAQKPHEGTERFLPRPRLAWRLRRDEHPTVREPENEVSLLSN